MTKRNILSLLTVIIIAVPTWYWLHNYKQSDRLVPPTETGASSQSNTGVLKQDAWNTFQNYLTVAKNHDLPGLTSLSYQLSDTCKDPKKTTECYKLMDNVYSVGQKLKEQDFINIWSDSKQVLLTSAYIEDSSDKSLVGYTRGIIYLIKDADDKMKILSFNDFDGVYVSTKDKTKDKTDVQIESDLQILLADTDQDGLTDAQETCTMPNVFVCTQTDPKNRDTNGNGWWDSTEALFYK